MSRFDEKLSKVASVRSKLNDFLASDRVIDSRQDLVVHYQSKIVFSNWKKKKKKKLRTVDYKTWTLAHGKSNVSSINLAAGSSLFDCIVVTLVVVLQ